MADVAKKPEVKKKLTWDDVGVLGDNDKIEPEPDPTAPTSVDPHRSLGTKAYERFWGTDVDEDPLEIIRLGSQVVGGVAGAWAGAAVGSLTGNPIGTGIGMLIGGAAGGMAGTSAPETAIEAAEALGLVEPDTRESVGLSNRELETVVEGEAILDAFTGGGIALTRLGVRAGAKALTGVGLLPGAKIGKKRMAQFAAEHGINMLPVQVGDRVVPRGFVAVMGKFPMVSGPIKRNIVKTEAQFKKAFEQLPSDIAPIATLDEVSGEIILDAKAAFKKTRDYYSKQFKDVYARADAAGATITPLSTTNKTVNLLAEIGKETPAAVGRKKGTHTKAMEEVRDFLANDIGPVFRQTKSGGLTTAPQTFAQFDTLLDLVSDKVGDLAKTHGTGAMPAISKLEELKHSLIEDMVTNANSPHANKIGQDFRALTRSYTNTIDQLFETTAAKKFGAVKRQGLKGFEFDTSTRTSVDQLAEVLIRGANVSEIDEIAKIIEPGTFKKMAAWAINKDLQKSMVNGNQVDLGVMKKTLGIGDPKSAKYQYTKKLLEKSGSPMTMADVEKLAEIGEQIGKVEAPDASSFIMRRGVMGGTEAIIRGAIPGATFLTAGGTAGDFTGAFVGSLIYLGGSRFVGKALTDPRIARPLLKVLDKETKGVVKKGAYMQIARMFANDMAQEGEGLDLNDALNWRRAAEKLGNYAYQRVQDVHRAEKSHSDTGVPNSP